MTPLRDKLVDAATIVVACCALVLTGMILLDRRDRQTGAHVTREVVGDWEQYSSGHRVGPEGAPVTIVVFGDYECPACQFLENTLRAVSKAQGDDIAIVYRHWPLKSSSYQAARAAECAANQGRFLQYHDLLYDNAGSIDAQWSLLASKAAIPDSLLFATCIGNDEPVESIERDISAVKGLGGRGTPTILINDRMVRSAPDSSTMEEIIAEVRQRYR